MQGNNKASAFILGAFLAFGLIVSGYLLGNTAIKFKEYERSVTVKGLSEQEHKADIVIWPIQFTCLDFMARLLWPFFWAAAAPELPSCQKFRIWAQCAALFEEAAGSLLAVEQESG